jgi:hypothetical protein
MTTGLRPATERLLLPFPQLLLVLIAAALVPCRRGSQGVVITASRWRCRCWPQSSSESESMTMTAGLPDESIARSQQHPNGFTQGD